MLTFLMCLLMAPAPVSPADVAPTKEGVIERFIASRENDSSIADDLKTKAIAATREAAKKQDARQEAITSGLKILSPEFDAALKTATAIGDDTLQRQSTGRVVPDSFTHGSAAQRRQWFMTGYQQGTVQACNTFAPGAVN